MHFLYECGQCGAFNQIDTNVWAHSKRKLSCHACGQSNIFGNVTEEITQPSVELVAMEQGDNIQSPTVIQDLRIYWECGVCQKASQFSSQKISPKGSKVTCNQCFNFILLRPMEPLTDVPMIKVEGQQEVKPEHDIREDKTTRVQRRDIVEVFENTAPPHQPMPSGEAVIKTGYADPRKRKESTKEAKIDPISVPDIDEIVPDPVPTQPPSIASNQNNIQSFTTQQPEMNEMRIEDPHPAPETQVKMDASQDFQPITSHEVQQISQAYMNPDNSFMAYKDFKEDDTFTYNFNEKDLKEIDPDENVPDVIKKVENNMIKYSLITSCVLIVLFAVFFFFREHKKNKIREKIEKENQQWIEEQQKEREDKPKYGFPEIAPPS